MFVLCFFFKQKTAYEMRISDWSSDVCSSDLSGVGAALEKIYARHLVAGGLLVSQDAAHSYALLHRRRLCEIPHRNRHLDRQGRAMSEQIVTVDIGGTQASFANAEKEGGRVGSLCEATNQTGRGSDRERRGKWRERGGIAVTL